MKSLRILPYLLAAATLLLLGANALPSTVRKQRLREQRDHLLRRLEEENRRGTRLEAEIRALRHDEFYIERMLVETWRAVPEGTRPFYEEAGGLPDAPED